MVDVINVDVTHTLMGFCIILYIIIISCTSVTDECLNKQSTESYSSKTWISCTPKQWTYGSKLNDQGLSFSVCHLSACYRRGINAYFQNQNNVPVGFFLAPEVETRTAGTLDTATLFDSPFTAEFLKRRWTNSFFKLQELSPVNIQ